jgi:dUTP pyrophosphatase
MNTIENMIPAVIRNNEYILKIFVSNDHETLRAFYRQRIQDHNTRTYEHFADSGFDLGLPKDFLLEKTYSNKISLGVHCAMFSNDTQKIPQAYYLYPRSSIVKTPLRLSNSVGIIDSGYRGEIMAFVDMIDGSRNSYSISAMDRYFQICHSSLRPFKVILVDTLEELGSSARGSGGFGSTGR